MNERVAVLYSLVYHCASDLQRARVEGSNASCQFWNFAADGKQDAQRLHHSVSIFALLHNVCCITNDHSTRIYTIHLMQRALVDGTAAAVEYLQKLTQK